MEHNFWKQLSPLDGFLIALNCVLLLLLFTAGRGQTAVHYSQPNPQTTAEQTTAEQTTAEQPDPPAPVFTVDDAAFIAAMLAP
jgi:flagellar basal body-associated protein FliL